LKQDEEQLNLILFQNPIGIPYEKLPINTALAILVDPTVATTQPLFEQSKSEWTTKKYERCMKWMEQVFSNKTLSGSCPTPSLYKGVNFR